MRTLSMVAAIAVAALWNTAAAGDCGCKSACNDGCGNGKVCRLVCEMKTVKVICWGCKCEDICIPCRSEKGCTHCESTKCGSCDACAHGGACKVKWTDWHPGGAEHKTVKKLVKYEVTKEIPSYRWEVVEGGCCNGGCHSNGVDEAPSEAPPAPPAAVHAPVIPIAPVANTTGDDVRSRVMALLN